MDNLGLTAICNPEKQHTMKNIMQNKRALIPALLGCILVNTACVNRIDEEIQASDIPICFTSKIEKCSTKASRALFKPGDQIGLFATLNSSDLPNHPYIDNLRLECSGSATLVPEKTVFYPIGNYPLNFISYYPFFPTGKSLNSTLIPVAVATNQSDSAEHNRSDFMVAQKTGVESSSKAVVLEYQHKLAKIKIRLTPSKDEKIEDLLKANPRIIATGLKTKASYNLQEDTFTELNSIDDITAFGKWSIEEGALTGKEIITLPQQVDKDHQSFTMEWNGKIYNCPFPELDLKSNTQCEIDISGMQTNSNALQGIIAEIGEWQTITGGSTDNQQRYAAIHLSALSFEPSNVYRVYHQGKPILEVCKEYLKSESLSSRAIVAYPILDNLETDLQQGTVLQLLDNNEAINGGRISWDPIKNIFKYEEGKSAAIKQFYLNEKKEILLNKTAEAINVDIISHTIRDIRNGKLKEYPIVKIGTQYWMRTELQATAYRNGKELSLELDLQKSPAYFKAKDNEFYFYNGEALLAGKLSPFGWKIPSTEDWLCLNHYIGEDAALIKSGTWSPMTEDHVFPNNNLTQFGAKPVGMWLNRALYANSQLTAFWSWDEINQTIPEKTFYLLGDKNTLFPSPTCVTGQDCYKALSIRCIKE